jgi:glyoxalase family protein
MANLEGLITGLHHITLVTRSEAVNRRFYTEVMGLRRVKLTVNQDDIYHRHLFYGDDRGTPGGTITFFEWPTLGEGSVGLGSPHHLAYSVRSFEALLKWRAWLHRNGVPVRGPYLRGSRVSIYLRDPDGVLLELTWLNREGLDPRYVQEAGLSPSEVEGVEPDMRLTLFNHASPISTDQAAVGRFFEKVLGLRVNYVHPNPDDPATTVIGVGSRENADFLLYINDEGAGEGRIGAGSIHHIAVSVEDEAAQRKILARLGDLGIPNSGIVDRFWFRSLYFRDIFGNLLEVATRGPGYTRDEPTESLGSGLALPPWLEPHRARIERRLAEMDRQNPPIWPPRFREVPEPPEATRPPPR